MKMSKYNETMQHSEFFFTYIYTQTQT